MWFMYLSFVLESPWRKSKLNLFKHSNQYIYHIIDQKKGLALNGTVMNRLIPLKIRLKSHYIIVTFSVSLKLIIDIIDVK